MTIHPEDAETVAKAQPAMVYASLESLEPLANLEVPENQAATATQKTVATANQIPVELTATQSSAPRT